MQKLRHAIKAALPRFLKEALDRRRRVTYRGLTTQEIFSRIYREGVWGRASNAADRFYSGTGSHHLAVRGPYVEAVSEFLRGFPGKPDVVDLGCGDFEIGSQLRPLCGRYVACDIVAPLIEFNRQKYRGLDVDFQVADLSRDPLPAGRVAFIRQVFQHLSNERILGALQRIQPAYEYLVVTEHLPSRRDFIHNLDKETGPDNRVKFGSGVVLTSAPFNLRAMESRKLCEVAEEGGLITTTVFRLK